MFMLGCAQAMRYEVFTWWKHTWSFENSCLVWIFIQLWSYKWSERLFYFAKNVISYFRSTYFFRRRTLIVVFWLSLSVLNSYFFYALLKVVEGKFVLDKTISRWWFLNLQTKACLALSFVTRKSYVTTCCLTIMWFKFSLKGVELCNIDSDKKELFLNWVSFECTKSFFALPRYEKYVTKVRFRCLVFYFRSYYTK